MLMVDGEGTPLSAFTTDAATSEVQAIETLVDERMTRRKPARLLYDKTADADWLRELLEHVTRVRLTQIMNLLSLAPDIQEAILFLPASEWGRESITERDLRPIAALADWRMQRKHWGTVATMTFVQ